MTGPEPGSLTAPFWEAATRRELVRPVCRSCGRNFFSPQIACPSCLGEDWEYRSSTGRGRVYSASVVHRSPGPAFDVPFRLAIVDLDEGWSMLANIVGGPDDRCPPSGTPVEVTWIERDGRTLPAFTEVAA